MIVAMKVLTAEKHPKADRLYIYTLRESIGKPVLQVCANLTNIYEVGDVAAVAQAGHVFDENFVMQEMKIRGAFSQGMMLGKTDAEPGTDVTEAFKDFKV